jgi:hypothetical protein
MMDEEVQGRMKRLPVLATAILLLIQVSGVGLSQEKACGDSSGKKDEIPEEVRASCGAIATFLVVYPALEVRTSEGQVRDLQDGSERPGCRVLAVGPTSDIVGEVKPSEALRSLLPQAGWEEDLRYAADGPGTTSFALRKNGVLCLFSGGAHSWVEDGTIHSAETYEFEAGCVPEPPGEESVPGR